MTRKQRRKRSLFSMIGLVILAVLLVLSPDPAFSDDPIDEINAAIKAAGANWVAAENPVTRMSPEKRRNLLGAMEEAAGPKAETSAAAPGGTALPTQWDWRNVSGSNYVSSVKNQNLCGSCFCFAPVAALESKFMITNSLPGATLDLSEQFVLSCSYAGDCRGGYPSTASDFLMDTGTAVESCFPYTASKESCSNACTNWQDETYYFTSWSYANSGEVATTTEIKNAIYNYGPVVVWFKVYSDFYSYSTGVYTKTSGTYEGNHVVLAVGWNDSNNSFICKNSWGPSWGDNGGYFNIGYSQLTGDVEFGYWTFQYGNVYGPSGECIPAVPLQVSPLDGHEMTSSSVTMEWTSGGGNSWPLQLTLNGYSYLIETVTVSTQRGLTELGPGTYQWRVAACCDGNCSGWSPWSTFYVGYVPTADTGEASLLSRTSALLQATVNPNGDLTTVEFQWGLDTSYGWVVSASPDTLTGTDAQSVSAEITGLDVNTVYHYRVVAENAHGMVYGEDRTFTSACSPQIAVTTGQFDTDAAWEFAIAETLADSTVLLTFYDNDGIVLGQASTGAVREISLSRGQFDADAQDEAVLACVMADWTLAAFIFDPDGSLVSQGVGGGCSNVTIATGQFDTDAYDEYVVTLLQSDGTLATISFNHDGTRVGKGIGGICSNLCVSTGNFDSNAADDEYVVSLLQSDGTLAAITFQGDGTRIGKGVGGLCTNVSVAAGNFRSDNDPQEEYVVSLLQSDGTLAAISFYGDGTRIGKGVGGVCTNVNIASGWYQATSPLDGYVVSLNQADNTPAAIFYTGTGTRIGKGTDPDAVHVTDIDCGDIDGDGYAEAVLGYIAESDLRMYWIIFKETGLEVMSGP